MKVSEAEKLICPFMSCQFGTNENGVYETTCITTKCMAWKVTKKDNNDSEEIRKLDKQFAKDRKRLHRIGEPFGEVYCINVDKMKEIEDVYNAKRAELINLEPQDCEGYCQRLSDDN